MASGATSMRLDRIQIEGYRRLEKIDLRLDGLNTFIGPNGVGKTSFLDVLSLLGAAMHGGLARGVASRAGFSRLLSRGVARTLKIKLRTEAVAWPEGSGFSPLEYEVELIPKGGAYTISKEYLTQQHESAEPFFFIRRSSAETHVYNSRTKKLDEWDWVFEDVDDNELALAQVTRESVDAGRLRDLLAGTRAYTPVLLDERSALRLPQTLQPNVLFPSAGGEDLISALYRLRSEYDDNYEELLDAVKAGFPGFEKLEFPLVAGGQAALAWYENGIKGPLYAN
jgi:predicted ATPase